MTFDEAMARLVSRFPDGCRCRDCRISLEALEVVKKEGDSRAAEMRERAARLVADETFGEAAEAIRALPLTEAKGNG